MSRGVRFPIDNLAFLDKGDIRAMCSRSYEHSTCYYLEKHLSSGDVVLDVGGNVGYIASSAAACVGVTGEVHAFEPLDPCLTRLHALARLNPDHKFFINNCAVGVDNTTLDIRFDLNGQSRVASLVMSGGDAPVSKPVKVVRLDDYVNEKRLDLSRIRIVKIDVEGYEFSVLRGLSGVLEKANTNIHIICEVNPWMSKKLGYTLTDMAEFMGGFGYKSYSIVPPYPPLDLPALDRLENVVFRR